jgi:hypothetical protein
MLLTGDFGEDRSGSGTCLRVCTELWFIGNHLISRQAWLSNKSYGTGVKNQNTATRMLLMSVCEREGGGCDLLCCACLLAVEHMTAP